MGKSGITDILVVGAGIFGLSCAYACVRRGMKVTVVDKDRPGSGASGGPVGALSPHPPERWNHKKQFQLETLLAAETHWAEVAERGGIDPGYGRTGRLIPLLSADERKRAEDYASSAMKLWPRTVSWEVLETADVPAPLDPAAAPAGVVHETLSARIDPPRAIAALVAALTRLGVGFHLGREVLSVGDGLVHFHDGQMSADRIILAGGYDGFALMTPALGQNPGQGIKGQAALVWPAQPFAGPMVYTDGFYLVPHSDGTLAIGSTSEAIWTDLSATDGFLEDLLARAARICPALSEARVLRRWAGARPRGYRPDPMLGPLPGHERVYSANGGFRTGLALGPAIGAALADMVTGVEPHLPPGMRLEDHLNRKPREIW